MEFEPVIGLEVHAQLSTDSKIFCSCPSDFGAPPNSHVCPVCLGMPGVLPVLNRRAVEYAMMFARAIGARIHPRSVFARKNYFYPDLPKGYQISQYDQPLATGGFLAVGSNGNTKEIGITRVHLEEDAGKSLHTEGADYTLVDMNRCGVPLIEIVSEPDISSPREAHQYLAKLKQILLYLDICTGDMEKGALRCDANVSVRPKGTKRFGTKTEVKNMNSFKGVERALAYEVQRQIAILTAGGTVVQETLLWDEKAQASSPMRSKEESHDYRYFPEPDLVPLVISRDWVDRIERSLPELPDAKSERFLRQYGIPAQDVDVLTGDPELADYFETAARLFPGYKKLSNWIMVELLAELKERKLTVSEFPVTPGDLAALLKLVDSGEISGKMAKKVFSEMVETGKDAELVIEEKGLKQISDVGALREIIEKILDADRDNVRRYYEGKNKLFGHFVGQVMKETRGQANPKEVNRLLAEILEAGRP